MTQPANGFAQETAGAATRSAETSAREVAAAALLPFRAPLLTAAAFLIAIADGITYPLLTAKLEATGVSGEWIGLNAAMPAVGWIAGCFLVPHLQIRLGLPLRRVLQMFVTTAIVALVLMRFAATYLPMTLLRLFLGGAVGVVFRCMEYWINSVSGAGERGRNLSLYSVLFMIALMIGSVLQPALGNEGWPAFGPPLMLAGVGLLLLQIWDGQPNATFEISPPPATFEMACLMPIALLAVLVFGIYESAPTTMLQIYAMKNGIGPAAAAYALAAAALGNILLQYPVAALSDRIGRSIPLLLCAVAAAAAAALLPFTLASAETFLAACAVLGAAAGSAYSIALAMVGDRFAGARLVVANAAFGLVYSVASIAGPLLNGFALDQMHSHGLALWLGSAFAGLAIVVGLKLMLPSARGET